LKKASDPPRDPEIDRFIDILWAQKGLAELTLSAYQQDLLLFSRWLEPQGSSLASADQASVQQFLAQRFDAGASARSNARLLSTLKQYYRHLVRLGDRQDSPTALISAPKIHRSLPQSMAESEVEKLLQAPDLESDYGLRDRCMLELMYSSGLRVSELVSLHLNQVNTRLGLVRLVGKGSKERVVPVGEEALHWMTRYLEQARPGLQALKANSDALFLSSRGSAITRQAFWGGRQDRFFTALAAPRLRHSPAQSRRRSTHRANVAGTQQPFDHANLHPHRANAPAVDPRPPPPTRLNVFVKEDTGIGSRRGAEAQGNAEVFGGRCPSFKLYSA